MGKAFTPRLWDWCSGKGNIFNIARQEECPCLPSPSPCKKKIGQPFSWLTPVYDKLWFYCALMNKKDESSKSWSWYHWHSPRESDQVFLRPLSLLHRCVSQSHSVRRVSRGRKYRSAAPVLTMVLLRPLPEPSQSWSSAEMLLTSRLTLLR